MLLCTCSGHCSLESLEVDGLYVIHTLGQTVCQFDLLLLHIDSGKVTPNATHCIIQHTIQYACTVCMYCTYVCTYIRAYLVYRHIQCYCLMLHCLTGMCVYTVHVHKEEF